MGNKLDLAKLFEPARAHLRRFREPYPTLRAELDAIASGKKAMSLTAAALDELASGEDQVVRLAFARGLAVVLYSRGLAVEHQVPSVFIAKPEQLWRVPAFLALEAAAFGGDARWSEAAEAQQGLLLGYTKRQRAEWRARVAQRQAGWGCRTVYTLITPARRSAIAALGHRGFDPADRVELFLHRGLRELRRDAWKRIPKGLVLARVGLARDASRRLFRQRTDGIEQIATRGERINRHLVTNLQILTSRGWK